MKPLWKRWPSYATLAILLTLPGAAFGQHGPGPQRPQVRDRQMLHHRVQMLRIWRISEACDLTRDQSLRFFPLLNDFDTKERKLRDERASIMTKLEDLVASDKSSDAEIQKTLDGLFENEKAMGGNRDRFREEVRRVLTLRQQAELVLANERFESELRGIVDTIKRQRGERPRE